MQHMLVSSLFRELSGDFFYIAIVNKANQDSQSKSLVNSPAQTLNHLISVLKQNQICTLKDRLYLYKLMEYLIEIFSKTNLFCKLPLESM